MLAPLLLAALLTLAVTVVIGMRLNYANIIALPLLLGIGVAFDIYFVMNWRAGQTRHLQSSTARAVLFSALTTMSAFGSLALSNDPGTAADGRAAVIVARLHPVLHARRIARAARPGAGAAQPHAADARRRGATAARRAGGAASRSRSPSAIGCQIGEADESDAEFGDAPPYGRAGQRRQLLGDGDSRASPASSAGVRPGRRDGNRFR